MIFLLLALQTFLHANIINEYYQKIESSDTHIGYAIIREEFLPKKNQFIVTTFTKTNDAGGSITESLKAFATADSFEPISYQYTLLVGDKTKTIDAVVRKGSLYATVTENKSKKSVQNKIPENAFFSSFLVQKMLKRGLAVGKNYAFEAVAEEDTQVTKGKVEIKEIKGENYRILNDFKQNRFYSYVSPKGVVVEVDNPITKLKSIKTSKTDAVGQVPFPETIIKTLFGDIPAGSKN